MAAILSEQGLSKCYMCELLYTKVFQCDMSTFIYYTNSLTNNGIFVWYSDESGIQVFGIQIPAFLNTS